MSNDRWAQRILRAKKTEVITSTNNISIGDIDEEWRDANTTQAFGVMPINEAPDALKDKIKNSTISS